MVVGFFLLSPASSLVGGAYPSEGGGGKEAKNVAFADYGAEEKKNAARIVVSRAFFRQKLIAVLSRSPLLLNLNSLLEKGKKKLI